MTSFMPAGQAFIRTPARPRWRAVAAAVAALMMMGWDAAAAAPPVGATVIQGKATFQQLGNSLLVTTVNGAGTNHSAIDWRSFNVPAGSITRFQQPDATSTSINRVTGGKPSDILGTLSSNGNLVLVNPSGITVGKDAVVDTAGFTASTLQMSDADALAGRLRFSDGDGKGNGKLNVQGRIVARAGDVVLIGTDLEIDGNPVPPAKAKGDDKDDKKSKDDKHEQDGKDDASGALPSLEADNGSIIIAAGQQVEVTGRGLEGIVLQLAPKGKIEIKKDARLHADAVGLFASQLKHSGVIEARRVVLQDDKVRLESGGDDSGKGNGNSGSGNSGSSNGNSGNGGSGNGNSGQGSSDSGSGNSGNGNSGQGSANSGSSNSGSANSGSGNSGSSNSGSSNSGSSNSGSSNSGSSNSGQGSPTSGSGNSDSGSSGQGSANSGSGNSGQGSANSGSSNSGQGSADPGSGNNSGSANSGTGSSGSSGNSGSDTASTGGSVPTVPTTPGDIATRVDGGGAVVITQAPVSTGTTGGTPAAPATPSSNAALQAALVAPPAQTVALSGAVLTTYTAPAVTPAQALNDDRNQERFSALPEKHGDKAATQDAAQCTP